MSAFRRMAQSDAGGGGDGAMGYDPDKCSLAPVADPLTLKKWADMTAEERGRVIRLRINQQLRCYEVAPLERLIRQQQLQHKKPFDPETKVPFTPHQIARIQAEASATTKKTSTNGGPTGSQRQE